jgi:hypothetical protein
MAIAVSNKKTNIRVSFMVIPPISYYLKNLVVPGKPIPEQSRTLLN